MNLNWQTCTKAMNAIESRYVSIVEKHFSRRWKRDESDEDNVGSSMTSPCRIRPVELLHYSFACREQRFTLDGFMVKGEGIFKYDKISAWKSSTFATFLILFC